MATIIRLHIELPDSPTMDEEFDKDSIIIGSGPSATCRIDSEHVSSMHAIIKVQDDKITISDLGSEAGTSVGGKSISDEVPLKAGDRIRLGKVEMTIETGAAEESENVSKKDETTEEKSDDSKEVKTASEASTDVKAEAKSEDKAEEAKAEPDKKAASKKAKAGSAVLAAPGTRPSSPQGRESSLSARARSGLDGQDLDESVLATPLVDANQPTAAKHALEISAHWGDTIMDSLLVYEPRDVTVSGQATHHKHGDLSVEIPLPNLENHVFTIAQNRGTEASIIVPSDSQVGLRTADGKVTRDVSLQATDAPFPAKSFELKFGERLAFKVGTVTFVAQYVRGDAELGKGTPMDWYFPRIFIISALFHAFFVVAAFVTPKYATSLTDDLFKNQNRFAQMILKAPEKQKKRKKLDLSGSKGGAKHRGDEGKFGKKDKPKKDALASKAGAPRVDPNKREKDRKIALNSGLLGILKGSGASGAVSNVFGPGGLGTGINNAMGGLRGTAMGDAGGAGGLGTRGAGAGGGGNSLGIGGLGTHGHGRGTGGYGNIDLGGRGKGTTRVVPGRTIIKGSLSKAEIGRVIRRNLARFKYCYEKQLNANPNLSGKISIYFVIAPTGSVAKASIRETSMNDSKVERCATKVMKSLKFPQPRGGGVVVVTYPFVFAST